MSNKIDAYKYKIDRKVLDDFYLSDSEPTDEHLREINKVITVVLIKHYSSYINSQDLRQFAILAVLERRSQFDPSFSSYNYTFSAVRNEIGNKIKKYSKEVFVEDYTTCDTSEYIYSIDPQELPVEVRRYCDYLTGVKRFTFTRIPKSDVLNLLLFLRLHDTRNLPKVPDYVQDESVALPVLYKICNELIKD